MWDKFNEVISFKDNYYLWYNCTSDDNKGFMKEYNHRVEDEKLSKNKIKFIND